MNFVSIGDLALTFQNNRQNTQIKSDLNRLASELASGKKGDISQAVTGDYSPFVSIERSIKSLTAFETVTSEVALLVATMQNTLEVVQNKASSSAASLLTASSGQSENLLEAATTGSFREFESVVAKINTKSTGRSIFAGTATDTAPLIDARTIMVNLKVAISTQTTAQGIENAVDNWFNAPSGGFDIVAYQGSTTSLATIKISDTEYADMPLTAADPSIRETLKSFALAALVGEGALAGDVTERSTLARISAESLLGAESQLIQSRAEIGVIEEKISFASTSNAAAKASFEIARSELTAIDPFRTATELESVSAQLETFYTITARLSRLSLTDYLR